MTSDAQPRQRKRLPPWLKKRLPAGAALREVTQMLQDLRLVTVCDGAQCPNRGECFARRTATFMILGSTCTRQCTFCAVEARSPGPVRPEEADAVAEAAARLKLKHVVITSVTRDDLPDGGAGHFARTIRAVRARVPETVVEVLTPDFQGSRESIDTVLAAGPDVFNHNVETAPRLYGTIRPQADYRRSLDVLRYADDQAPHLARPLYTKSGFMVGVGETDEEVQQILSDLRAAACDIVTIGQYLSPSDAHAPVERFVPPEQFDAWADRAREMGFASVAAGPFVRSSYHAEEVFRERRR